MVNRGDLFDILAYNCEMAKKRKRRVYIIRHTDTPPDDEMYSSLTKVSKNLKADLSYNALAERLRKARLHKGKSLIHLKDECGNPIIVEVRELE